jgi:hypothetical protein
MLAGFVLETLAEVVNSRKKNGIQAAPSSALGGEPEPAWDAVSSSAPVSIRAPSAISEHLN